MDIAQEVSRHFDDKIEFRKKLASKDQCEPCPQNSIITEITS